MANPPRRDIQTVLTTLYTLYGNPNPTDFESVRVASKWLTDLQFSIDAWEVAHQLLNLNTDTEYVNYFAANTMHSKVRDSFKELPKDAHVALRDSLLHHLTLRASKPCPVTMQLVLALADLALQMEGWETVVDDVIARFSSDVVNVPTLLDILVVLPEEIDNRTLRLGTNRRDQLRDIMSRSCRTVLELLVASLAHWPNEGTIKIKIYNCLGSWVTLRSFPVEEVAASSLVIAPFLTLNDLKAPDKLYEAAADCICAALYVCYDIMTYEPLALVLQQQVNQLLPVFVAVIETENSLRANCLVRIFTEMSESFLYNIIHCPDTAIGSMKTLDLIVAVCKHYDYELLDLTFPVWYRLSELLNKLSDKQTKSRFVNHINELINGLVKHCQFNDDLDNTEMPDEKGDFVDFRRNVVEVMKDLILVVDSIDIFQKLYNIICSPNQPWNVTESCLFLMYSIASSISGDETSVLPIALPVLLSVPPTTHYAVRATTLRLISELSHWISKHPEILNEVLKFLHVGLSIRPLASISAIGIQHLCQRCKGQMANLFDSLVEIIQAADTLGISNNSVIGLMTGAVNIIQDLPHDRVSTCVYSLCLMSIQNLMQIVQLRPVSPQPSTHTDPALWTDRLSAVFRQLDYTPSPDMPHPAINACKEVLPPICATFEIYKDDPRIVERSCRCLRFMLRCLRSHANPIIEDIIRVTITMYQANSHSCYLYLGSIIVDEFGPYPINHAGLIAMTESFVQVSFALLSTNTGLIDNPDTVDDMFRLCARMIQRCPVVFLRSPIAQTAVDCGMAASQHMHREAFSSVMKFFKDLAHAPFDENLVEPDHSEATMLTYQILAAHGQKLIENLIQGFISLPYDMIMESSSVFWELVHYYTEFAIKWVESAMAKLDSPKITNDQKIKFLHQIQQSALSEDHHLVEKNIKELARIFR